MHLKTFRISRQLMLLTIATAILAATAGSASAVHWPFFGGDAGRSGYQPVDEGGLPIAPYYELADSEKPIKTSIITTTGGGTASNALMAYGTELGAVHHQLLFTGAPVGPEAGQDVDDGSVDTDVLGSTVQDANTPSDETARSVTPVDSSTAGSTGITFVVHNDDNQDGADNQPAPAGGADPRTGSDIALAAIDQQTGFQLFDNAIGPKLASEANTASGDPKGQTINFTINSSPVLTQPDGAGSRFLFFLASRASASANAVATQCTPTGTFETTATSCTVPAATRLFRVKITFTDAQGVVNPLNAKFSNADIKAIDVVANTDASPAIVNLNSSTGTEPHIAVPGSDGFLRTYQVDSMDAGPVSPDLGTSLWTPAAPVMPNGLISTMPPPIFVPVYQDTNTDDAGEDAADATQVKRLVQTGAGVGALSISPDAAKGESYNLAGPPSRALAITQETDNLSTGRIIVTTWGNAYSLDATDLKKGNRYDFADSLAAGTTGFRRTQPAASGDLVYTMNDRGEQLVLDEITMEPVSSADFTSQAISSEYAANEGIGQPSISRGFIQFGNKDGVFVYRNQTAPTVTLTAPADGATVSGTIKLVAKAFNVRSGVQRVNFKANGVVVGFDDTPTGATNTDANGGAEFSYDLDTTRIGNGQVTFTAEAVDNDTGKDAPSETGVSEPRTVTINNAQGTTFAIDDQTVAEGDSGSKTVTFTVTKTGSAAAAVTAATENGTASAGSDYDAAGPTVLSFGAQETAKTFQVTVKGDTADEIDETFKVRLSNPTNGTAVADPEGLGLITDDDAGPGEQTPALLVSDATIVEGDIGTVNAVFQVTMTQSTSKTVTVSFSTRDESAKAPLDYTTVNGSLTFTPGQTGKTVVVPVRGDTELEQPERFLVALTNPSNASLGDGTGVGTIIDNENLPGSYKVPIVRKDPRSLTASTKPRKDTSAPYRFTTSGRLSRPSGVSVKDGCQGRVDVTIKAVRKTISTRRVNLRSNCTYSSRVTFRDNKRFSKSGKLTVTARFRGNTFLKPIRSKQHSVSTK